MDATTAGTDRLDRSRSKGAGESSVTRQTGGTDYWRSGLRRDMLRYLEPAGIVANAKDRSPLHSAILKVEQLNGAALTSKAK